MKKEVTFTFDLGIFTHDGFDVDRITKVMDIEPTRKWHKGDAIKEGLFRKESCWSLISEETESLTFERPFTSFCSKVLLKRPGLSDLVKESGLKLQINAVVKIYNGSTMPGIHINSELINMLSDLNCSIDFDIYDLR